MFSLILSVVNLCLMLGILCLAIRDKDRIKELEKQLEIKQKQERRPEDRYSYLVSDLDTTFAFRIARRIINMCISKACPISNLQLNRIMFLFYAECCKQGINHVRHRLMFEAWDYGPVCRPVYMNYCAYGATKLTIRESEVDNEILGPDAEKILEHVIKYAEASPWQLQKACTDHKGYKSCYKEGEKNLIQDKFYK